MSRPKRKLGSPFTGTLNSLLKERGVGVREAGRLAGVAPSTISGWCAGTLPDNFAAVKKLASALGVSLSFLLTGEDDRGESHGPTTITEIFDDGGMMFDGYAKISIQRLLPRKGKT